MTDKELKQRQKENSELSDFVAERLNTDYPEGIYQEERRNYKTNDFVMGTYFLQWCQIKKDEFLKEDKLKEILK